MSHLLCLLFRQKQTNIRQDDSPFLSDSPIYTILQTPSKILLSLIVFASTVLSADHTRHIEFREPMLVRGCTQVGFFAEFLWTLNYLEWCLSRNQIPIVYWGTKFAYYSPEGFNSSNNGWEYYFEPVSSLTAVSYDLIDIKLVYNNNFSAIWEYSEYINNLHLLSDDERKSVKAIPLARNLVGLPDRYPVNGEHIYSKSFRTFIKEN